MADPICIDLSTYGYDEFVSIFFDRTVRDEPIVTQEDVVLWYEQVFPEGSQPAEAARPDIIVGHLTRVFTEFVELGRRFPYPQLDQGCWRLLCSHEAPLNELWREDVRMTDRVACIESMLIPFRDFVPTLPRGPIGHGFGMWWDFVCESFWRATRWRIEPEPSMAELEAEMLIPRTSSPEQAWHEHAEEQKRILPQLNTDERRLHHVMLTTLHRILRVGDCRVDYCALHGLGHLHHPGVAKVVQEYIDRHAELLKKDFDHREWVERCKIGEIM